MSAIIFYGAGKYAKDNLSRWEREGLIPICFADADTNKHGQTIGDKAICSLDYVVEQYSDFDIYLTVGVETLGKVTDYLIQKKNISAKRIKYPDAVEKRKGCKFIGTRIQFFGDKFATCCMPRMRALQYSESFGENYENYTTFCRDLLSKLRSGEKTICDDCAQLKYDFWPVEPKLEVIGFDTAFKEDYCNFKCIYCSAVKNLGTKSLSSSIVDAVRELERFSNGEHRNIVLASGEISVSPYRDEVLDIIRSNGWNVDVFTNASVFSQKLADLIYEGHAKIHVSMDAGTPETFAKIKGINCWEKVVNNLKQYTETAKSEGQIKLKYILLNGINDNATDIEGFAELAGQLNAHVVISSNSRNDVVSMPLPEQTYNCALELGRLCKKNGISFSFVSEFFNPHTYRRLNEALNDV